MTDKSYAFAGANIQIEVIEYRIALFVLKNHIIELNVALKRFDWTIIGLLDSVIRVNQRENALDGAQPLLKLTPKAREINDGKPETINTLDEEIPRPNVD